MGYRTSTHDSDYPREIQAAEAKVQALNDANATSANQVSAAGSSGAKGRQTPAGVQ
ncbi:hypothetical protein PAMC26510_20695 [Caballeronia sordidicola]|uniref:Uncharacterized protein n=1 Tax=Caballeronia sordidicola TaxID=196367 RepID=A0A242MNK4_CABSO|nr:hypothetical protein PAMC26510_20695 [Caballeronia sordidicola]